MTADNVPLETNTDRTGENSGSFSWQKELLLATAMVISIIASSLASSWYTGRDIRPWTLAGLLLVMSVAFTLGVRRRWRNTRYPQMSTGATSFSLAELLIYVSALAIFLGFLELDRPAAQQFQRERDELQAAAAGVLGPDGRILFMPDGSLHVAICDRTFDDARLARLAEVIDQWKAGAQISELGFGSGANTNNIPPVWPGITDQSIPLLMQWQELELLSVYGTAISENGREQLRTLPRLNRLSQHMLAR